MVYRFKIKYIYLRLKDVFRKEEVLNVYLYFKILLFFFFNSIEQFRVFKDKGNIYVVIDIRNLFVIYVCNYIFIYVMLEIWS